MQTCLQFEDLGERVRMSRSSVLSALILAGKGRTKTITEDRSVWRSNARAAAEVRVLLAPCLQLAAGLMRCRRAAAATAEALRGAKLDRPLRGRPDFHLTI